MTSGVRRRVGAAVLLVLLVPLVGVAPRASAQAQTLAISAEPSTGLADGQPVTVTVSGPLEGDRAIRQCTTGATDRASCNSFFGVYPDDGGPGGTTTTVVVDNAIGLLDGTTVDCRVVDACSLVVGDPAVAGSSAAVALTFDPAAPLVAPPTVTVTPGSGVVDRDRVTVAGVGFRTDEYVFVAQCRLGALLPEGCDGNASGGGSEGGVGADGTFTAQVTVDASFLSYGGEVVDCRSEACVLVALNASETASVALGFDPAAPLRTATMTVVPATGLVDGQVVDVDVQLVADRYETALRLCVTDDAAGPRCGPRRYLDVDDGGEGGGSIAGRFTVDASFRTGDGTVVDCRTTSCSLVAGEIRDPGDAAAVVLTFDPDAPLRPEPVVTIEPSGGLVDGQVVEVEGSGFLPRVGVEISQCPAPASPADGCSSSGFGTYEQSGDDGSIVTRLAVAAVLTGHGGEVVDCRSSAGACVLMARAFSGDDLAVAPLDFDPAGPLLPPPTLEAEPSTGLQDGSVVTVRGTGFRSGEVLVEQCAAAAASVPGCGGDIDFAEADVTGVVAVSAEVRAVVRGPEGEVDCTVSAGACVLVARGGRGGTSSNAVPLTFGPAPEPRGRYLDEVFSDVTVTRDVVYGQTMGPDGRPLDLRIDIYEPAGDTTTSRPAMLWMHGGNFSGGDKSNMARFAEAMARRGYVSASVQYRLNSDPNIGVRAEHAYLDLRAAVEWLADHAEEYGVDPGAIATGGYSAGAVTALNLAYGPDRGAGDSAGVVAAVSLAGVQTTGTVEPGEAPALFFHAPDDSTVPYDAGRAVCDRVLAAGIVCEFVTYEGVGHGLTGFHRDITRRTAEFLVANVLDPPAPPGPTADAGGPYAVVEGSTVTLDGTGSTGDDLRFSWSPADRLVDATGPTPRWTGVDDGTSTVELEVTDAAGTTARSSTTVVVENAPPVIERFTVSPAGGGRNKKARIAYADPGSEDTHTVVIDWGDGTQTDAGPADGDRREAERTKHRYTAAGSYVVTATVTDDDGGSATSQATVTVRR